jgi:YHS domain-containing protein
VQDVPSALLRKGLSFSGYLNPNRPAILESAYMSRVNYETYFFADTAARELFNGDVVRFCGLITDPVSKQRFRPEVGSPRFDHEEVTYYFASAASQDLFEGDPESYWLPGYTM